APHLLAVSHTVRHHYAILGNEQETASQGRCRGHLARSADTPQKRSIGHTQRLESALRTDPVGGWTACYIHCASVVGWWLVDSDLPKGARHRDAAAPEQTRLTQA